MDVLFQIAPTATWLRVLIASLAILAGVLAFGHARVLMRAYGVSVEGPFAMTAAAIWLRWAAILVATGLMLWGTELGWPVGITGALIGAAALVLAAELYGRVGGMRRPRG